MEGSWGWGICQDIWGKLGGKLGGSRKEIERKGGGNWRESKAQFAGKHWGKLGEIGGKLVPIGKEIGKHIFFNGVSKGKTPNTVCLKVVRKRQHTTSAGRKRRREDSSLGPPFLQTRSPKTTFSGTSCRRNRKTPCLFLQTRSPKTTFSGTSCRRNRKTPCFFNGVSKGKTPNTVCLRVFRTRQLPVIEDSS